MYRDIPGTSLEKIVNTRFLILRDGAGKHYLRIADGWMTAPSLGGSWTVADFVPPSCERVAIDERMAALLMGADLEGLSTEQSLKEEPAPYIYIDIEAKAAERRTRPRS